MTVSKKKRKQRRLRLLVNYQGLVCAYCGCDLTEATKTIDHVIPRSKGGRSDYHNLVLACKSCNSHKSDKEVGTFKRLWITPLV